MGADARWVSETHYCFTPSATWTGQPPIVGERVYVDDRGVRYRVTLVRGLKDAVHILSLSLIWEDPPRIVIDYDIWMKGGWFLEFTLWHESQHRLARDELGMTKATGTRNARLDFTLSAILQMYRWRKAHRGETFPNREMDGWRCGQCDQQFISEGEVRAHLTSIHGVGVPTHGTDRP